LDIREAALSDVGSISDLLQELVASGQRAGRTSANFVRSHYLEHAARLNCFVAVDVDGKILGLQSLKLAADGNPYGTPAGWGIIGTHVRPSAGRRGIGARLFAITLKSAQHHALPAIEAYIAETNCPALAFYETMGFRDFRWPDGIVCKVREVGNSLVS